MEIKDLDNQIKDGSIGRLYFFCGEEQFLMENKIKSIRKALLEPDFADLNFVCLEEKKLPISRIYEELMSVPVMSDKKIVVIKNSGLFNNAKLADYKTLCELISDIPDYMCVIFTEREFDEKKAKNLEPLKAHGEIITFDPLSPVQLERWLDKLFSDKGKRIIPRDINTIIRMCGQNMSLLFNEYNKLLSFVGDREKITAEDIEAVVSRTTEARLFDVIDSLAAGRKQNVFSELVALRTLGEDPSAVLSLLSSRLGELLMVKQLSIEGLSADKISSYFYPKRPTFVANKLLEQAKPFTEDFLKRMALLGLEYTALVRSGKLDKWIAVEMYAARLLEKRK